MDRSGQLVTPVTGEPAAKINWAGPNQPCPACQTRTCEDCDGETSHRAAVCRYCGSKKLGDPHRCTNTKANGTVESRVGKIQKLKCRSCGHSWTAVIKAPVS